MFQVVGEKPAYLMEVAASFFGIVIVGTRLLKCCEVTSFLKKRAFLKTTCQLWPCIQSPASNKSTGARLPNFHCSRCQSRFPVELFVEM